ncbi:MAG TPA: RNA pseudouridine synthase [Chitinophagaceae bacterium]|nr:RNA pseudouridine synthase [Chitinophagaceae bacterium]
MKLKILFEDENYIIVHKPSGILSIPDRHNEQLLSIRNELIKIFKQIFVVHRIDRDTSGCICFAKNEKSHQYLSTLFTTRQVEKIYLGIIHGCFEKEEGIIDKAIAEHPYIKGKMIINAKAGKSSITEYRVLESFGKFSLVEYKIQTGRTHQIRIHSADLGNPIVCDAVYGIPDPVFISSIKKNYKLSKSALEETPILNRLALHAHQISFIDESRKKIQAVDELPKDMNSLLNQSRKWL